jgi:hypothetical protein
MSELPHFVIVSRAIGKVLTSCFVKAELPAYAIVNEYVHLSGDAGHAFPD